MKEKRNTQTKSVLYRLFLLVWQNKPQFLGTLWLVIGLSIVSPFRPYLIQYTVDNAIGAQNIELLIKLTWWMIALLVLEAIMRYGFTFLSTWLGQRAIRVLRARVFENILKQKLRFFDQTPIGTLTTRTVSDIEVLAEVFSQGFLTIFGDLLQLIAVLVFMFYTDVKLTLVSLFVMPLLVWASYLFKEKVKASFTDVRTQVAKLNAYLQEQLTGMGVIKIFNLQQNSLQNFVNINKQLNEANLRSIFYYAVFFPVVEILTAVSLGLLVWWGAHGALQGTTSVGVLIAFILYVNMLFRPIRMLADKFNSLQMGIVSGERVFKILDSKEIMATDGTFLPVKVQGALVFDRVNFSYDQVKPILKNLNFEIKPGQKAAFVGSTGAGKSSIINVLSRFYEYQSGNIFLDGIELRAYHIQSIREHIGVILQDVFLFSGTIFENITLNNPQITLEQVENMAAQLGIDRFIHNLPGGYAYQVQERGNALSAGQRQLIAFLRVMVYQPEVLILDEATAAIDSETEAILQHATDVITRNRTSIVIAHRLSTIYNADLIMVVENGEIIERGNHQMLLNLKGKYYELYQMQLKLPVQNLSV